MKDPHFWAFFALLALGFVIWQWEATTSRPIEEVIEQRRRWSHCTGGVLIGCTRQDVCTPYGCTSGGK